MGTVASAATVRAYLVTDMGYTSAKADELVKRYSNIVDQANRMRSFAYYPAGKIHEQMIKDDFDGKEPSDDWEGYDPNWVEPSEDDELEEDEE